MFDDIIGKKKEFGICPKCDNNHMNGFLDIKDNIIVTTFICKNCGYVEKQEIYREDV